jgi:hypothetical protein
MPHLPPVRQRGARGLGILLLVLGLVHVPLPEPDFHNIRHHDGPGEVCEQHDHLLRWHPGAGKAEDVAVLHWHWFLPLADPSGLPPAKEGLALHAHVANWFASTWDELPRLLPDSTLRWLDRKDFAPPSALPVALVSGGPALWRPGLDPCRRLPYSATFAPRAPLSSLLQRWTC